MPLGFDAHASQAPHLHGGALHCPSQHLAIDICLRPPCGFALVQARGHRDHTCTTDSRTASSSDLSTSDGSVSSSSTLGPWRSGPNAQIERAASRSQSYFCCAPEANNFREQQRQAACRQGASCA